MTVIHHARTQAYDYLDVTFRGCPVTFRRDRSTGQINRTTGRKPGARFALWSYVTGDFRQKVEAAFQAEFA